MFRKIYNIIADLIAVLILIALGSFSCHLLYTLFMTPLGAVTLSTLGVIVATVWACHRIFRKRQYYVK